MVEYSENVYEEKIEKRFEKVAITVNHAKWDSAQSRMTEITKKPFDTITEFERDNNRILHSKAYRRLKHKTQVFFATNKDHICTRIEHVNHVASIARSIARNMGLNLDLVEAIALGHDLGHSPFGHHGEVVLGRIIDPEHKMQNPFWHEFNSLRFIDKIETLPNYFGHNENLNLTYAVRDGIVCHCGEVDENALKPRNDFIDLETVKKGQVMPYTYEGCVVKISDKIAYLGRDIEDAFEYKILGKTQYKELKQIVENIMKEKRRFAEINTTSLMYEFIKDLCYNSNPQDGLNFSKECFEMINQIKEFNYKNICFNKRLDPFKNYATLVLNTIYDFLESYYDSIHTIGKLERDKKSFPILVEHFQDWLIKYSNIDERKRLHRKCYNKIIYNINEQSDYKQAVIDFISGMTDQFAIKTFEEIITF